MRPLVVVLALGLGLPVGAADHPQLKAFPAAKEGQERYVITLPHKERGEDESSPRSRWRTWSNRPLS